MLFLMSDRLTQDEVRAGGDSEPILCALCASGRWPGIRCQTRFDRCVGMTQISHFIRSACTAMECSGVPSRALKT